MYIQKHKNLLILFYSKSKKIKSLMFQEFVYIKIKNLGRVSDLKINFVKSTRSFPDFLFKYFS